MIIKRTGKYDRNRKEFIVINYCCAQMGRDMAEYDYWSINDSGEMFCSGYEGGVGGIFCAHCGEKITIH